MRETAPSERRHRRVWLRWLRSLERDSDAALGLSQLYARLSGDERAGLLSVLEADARGARAPVLALIAPLLAVEDDPVRIARLVRRARHLEPPGTGEVWRSAAPGHVQLVFFLPAYLSFGELLSCVIDEEGALLQVEREPLVHVSRVGARVQALHPTRTFAPASRAEAVDEVARAILQTRRRGAPMPVLAQRLVQLLHPEPRGPQNG